MAKDRLNDIDRQLKQYAVTEKLLTAGAALVRLLSDIVKLASQLSK